MKLVWREENGTRLRAVGQQGVYGIRYLGNQLYSMNGKGFDDLVMMPKAHVGNDLAEAKEMAQRLEDKPAEHHMSGGG